MSDFEQAIINSLKSTFKSAAHKCCFFHFFQAIIRRCKGSKEIWDQYVNNLNYSIEIRKLFALSFVPTDKVVPYFEQLMLSDFFKQAYNEEEFPSDSLDPPTSDFVVYFEHTWVQQFSRNNTKSGLFGI